MILTIALKNKALQMVENSPGGSPHFAEAIKKRILNSTIRLTGTAHDGRSLFSGSGVIFFVDAGGTYILTAAHNLLVWLDKAYLVNLPSGFLWSDYTADFGHAVSIGYGVDMTFNKAHTANSDKSENNVDPPPAQPTPPADKNCLYDVLIIKSTDTALKAFASANVFGGQSYSQIKASVKDEATAVKTSLETYLDYSQYYLVQLGYGDITDERTSEKLDRDGKIVQRTPVSHGCEFGTGMVKNRLHYRLANPSFREPMDMFSQVAGAGKAPVFFKYVSTISTNGRLTVGTTAEGDSGGPLFAVNKDLNKAYLLGVTTGVDMQNRIKDVSYKDYVSHRIFHNCISTSIVDYLNTNPAYIFS